MDRHATSRADVPCVEASRRRSSTVGWSPAGGWATTAGGGTWVGRHVEQIELHFLPGYSPELNPVELLNQDVKENAAGRRRARSAAELTRIFGSICVAASASQNTPAPFRSYRWRWGSGASN
jgi:hypothetical protein